MGTPSFAMADTHACYIAEMEHDVIVVLSQTMVQPLAITTDAIKKLVVVKIVDLRNLH